MAGSRAVSLDLVVGSVVVDRFAGPIAAEQAEALVEPLGQDHRIGGVAEAGELVVDRAAEPGAEDDAATGQRVQGGNLSGQLLRSTAGHRCDQRAQTQLRRRQRGRGQQHPRIPERLPRSPLLVMHDVIPHEQRVPTRGFGRHRNLGDRPGVGEVPKIGNVDRATHPVSSTSGGNTYSEQS